MSVKAKIEAVLFLTDKPIHAAAIARLVNIDVQIVRQTLLELIHEYEERGGALEIAQDNGYMFQVKDEYAAIIEEFLPVEMSAALLRTLSAIAIKQPVPQSEIIRIRGAGAYDHIKELVIRELIVKKEEGRSPTLSTTRKFQEYFRLTKDAKSLRQQIRKQEAAAAKADEAGQLGLPLSESGTEAAAGNASQSGETGAEYDTTLDRLLDVAIGSVDRATAAETKEGTEAAGGEPGAAASGTATEIEQDRAPVGVEHGFDADPARADALQTGTVTESTT